MGDRLQPLHYEMFVANYSVLIAMIPGFGQLAEASSTGVEDTPKGPHLDCPGGVRVGRLRNLCGNPAQRRIRPSFG